LSIAAELRIDRDRIHLPKLHPRREVFDPNTGEFLNVPIYCRPEPTPGARIEGPAVIAEDEDLDRREPALRRRDTSR